MATLDELVQRLGERFGVLAESSTNQLTVIARNTDVAIGDLFLLPCKRGPDRFYVFRTTEYANVLNRTLEMNDVARNKLTMPDSYFAEDLADEKLVELRGMVLGYAQYTEGAWSFFRPRRLPQHLTDVYHVDPGNRAVGTVVRELMRSQLGEEGLFVGHLLAGERALADVPVYLPPHALSHHLGVFGRTGCGKSNLMMVLLGSVLAHNRAVLRRERAGPALSVFAIDPHDEFRAWHAPMGGADGLRAVVAGYSDAERSALVAPFYYLTARDLPGAGLERRVQLSRADVTPADLVSIMEFSEQQVAFANQYYGDHGETWIGRLLSGELTGRRVEEEVPEYLPGTVAAVQRRLGFLTLGSTRVFTRFDPEMGLDYVSDLPDIVCALESGRVIVVDTTLMGEIEQFLLNTVVARTLFVLRRALRSADTPGRLETEIRQGLGNEKTQGQVGLRSLAEALLARLADGRLPYRDGDRIRSPDELPYVNIVVEEAPSVLNPMRMRFGSVFRDISRQGRKFGIGLTVVSQQVTEIDQGVLTQLNTQLTMALGNSGERLAAGRNGAADLEHYEAELSVLSRGEFLISTSLRDVSIPVKCPLFGSSGV